MFDWIGEFVYWIAQIFPRLLIVRTTHRVVKFKRGKKLQLVEPGLTMWWPLVTEVVLVPVARQTINLPTQRLVTMDGKRVVASAVVVYTIGDAVEAVGKSWDYDETIRDISMANIAAIVTGHEYNTIVTGIGTDIRTELTRACRGGLMKYGVRVQRCLLTDFCPANVIALSNTGNGDIISDMEG